MVQFLAYPVYSHGYFGTEKNENKGYLRQLTNTETLQYDYQSIPDNCGFYDQLISVAADQV